MEAADVASAASLLAVVGNKRRGVRGLWRSVRSGGTLLIIEPTDKMTPDNAEMIIDGGLSGYQTKALRMWASARQGKEVDPRTHDRLGADSAQFKPLLQGLVGAWLIRKK
jgi:hypothetical protein